MKTFRNIKYIILGLSILLFWTGCNEDVTDFGFDGAISGVLKDAAGNIVAGDVTSNTIVVKALAEGDIVTIDTRVKGDGTYQNTKLYPNSTKFWVTGPVTMVSDTLRVNFADDNDVQFDFVVLPYLSIDVPVLVGSPTSSEITVSYAINGNDKVSGRKELYCSTVPYPNASTGSGPQYVTKTVSLSTDSGNATITGLEPGTKYYIRVGARAEDTNSFNYSSQIIVNTP